MALAIQVARRATKSFMKSNYNFLFAVVNDYNIFGGITAFGARQDHYDYLVDAPVKQHMHIFILVLKYCGVLSRLVVRPQIAAKPGAVDSNLMATFTKKPVRTSLSNAPRTG